MVKDFIDTNEFTREQLVDMIELSLAIKRAVRSGYYPPLMQDMTLGMIFQQFNLLAQRNVIQNVCFPLEIAGASKKEAKDTLAPSI